MTVDVEALRRRAETVRGRLALSDLIGADVRLTQRGREHVGLCPFHSETKLGSFSVNDDKQIFKCFTCGAAGDHLKYLQLRKGWSFMEALKALEADAGIDFRDARSDPQWERRREKKRLADAADVEKRRRRAVGLWMSGAPIAGTPAEAYLRGRGIDFAVLGRFPGAIRYRHDCWNNELAKKIPAMVTKMTALDGTHVATHRTFLEYGPRGWTKATVEKAKKILGNFAGAHIALTKGDSGRVKLADVAEGTAIGVSEGIEDGLTVAMADPQLRVIAAASLDNIGNVALPAQVSDVVLVCQRDHDARLLRAAAARAAGDEGGADKHERAARDIEAAVERQIARLQDGDRTVRCMWPAPGFKDFNDQLRGVRMEDS